MSFYDWMNKYDGKDTPRGDLIYDMKRDDDFPKENSREAILNHLIVNLACPQCIAVFKRCWKDYEKEVLNNGNE